MTTIARWAATVFAGLLMLGATAATAQMRTAPPGGMCGGIAGIQCPSGQTCVMTGPRHPDQSGTCRPTQTPPPPPGGGHTICPQIFKPVCGVNNVTYPNACIAGARGVAVAHDGQCGIAPPRPPRPRPPQTCGMIWQPVCGTDGRTYPNPCVAASRGATIDHPGQCDAGPPPPQVCPDIYQPVCGRDGMTYPNACNARAAGVPVRHRGECRPPRGYGPPPQYGAPPTYGLPPQPVPYGSYQPTPYAPPPPPRYGERG